MTLRRTPALQSLPWHKLSKVRWAEALRGMVHLPFGRCRPRLLVRHCWPAILRQRMDLSKADLAIMVGTQSLE